MATFTIALKDAIELEPLILEHSLATYPIFDESYRGHLNKLILDQFWNQEIGQETIELFRLALRRKMEQIMPLYNQQYLASRIKYDPLQTVNISNKQTSTGKTVASAESATNSTSDAKSRAVAQELPQTMLSGNGDYATNAQDNISNTAAGAKSNDASNTVQDGSAENTTTGFQGNPAMMILQYRQSLVNVDMMVLDELKELFMLIWSNGDEFGTTGRGYFYGYFGY